MSNDPQRPGRRAFLAASAAVSVASAAGGAARVRRRLASMIDAEASA